ncbi:T9SS type A sorting domain-containing protein [Pedobacter caeni]|uniref:Por secretion system C-terminal sorting domain-containing protein n=1 Tax=Pedobacter caeni TaxID=288992 RepID=A0A1M5JXV7_9SPHI|nr:T9SS type A sorting domain-containing protein [Pedobacter caeni]SHG45348.1 Por secretion system C-terminal sorting domain-containing protein [Pedobacter caeni]
MNKLYFILATLFMVSFANSSFAQKLTFSYDASGNQTERKWVCANCKTANDLATAAKMLSTAKEDQKDDGFATARSIKVYPNPLSESLNVTWQTTEKIFLKSIEVFNVAGNKVFSARYEPGHRETQISFLKLPPGVYILVGYYSDSKTESVKLIKI